MPRKREALAVALMISLLGGCTSITPNGPTSLPAGIDANRAGRGTPEFCKRYAAQTYVNTFQTNSDTSSSAGADMQAGTSGSAAYQRCLQGKTN